MARVGLSTTALTNFSNTRITMSSHAISILIFTRLGIVDVNPVFPIKKAHGFLVSSTLAPMFQVTRKSKYKPKTSSSSCNFGGCGSFMFYPLSLTFVAQSKCATVTLEQPIQPHTRGTYRNALWVALFVTVDPKTTEGCYVAWSDSLLLPRRVHFLVVAIVDKCKEIERFPP